MLTLQSCLVSNKDLDIEYIDTWIRRESNLKGISYYEYLKSDWWNSIKEKAKKRSDVYSSCQFCGTKDNIHLHHTSYKWIYTKHELLVIIPLCCQHHYEVHYYAKNNNISVRRATNIIRRKYRPDWNDFCRNKSNKI